MIVILNRGAGRHQDEAQAQIKKFFQSEALLHVCLWRGMAGRSRNLREGSDESKKTKAGQSRGGSRIQERHRFRFLSTFVIHSSD
jgi:hypothetical protein